MKPQTAWERFIARRRWSGLLAIGVVMVLKVLGAFQPLEWKLLDFLMRSRPPEPQDARITIVGINEADIAWLRNYPLSDQQMADLIQALNRYQPRVIGIDVFRDLPDRSDPEGAKTLADIFQNQPNVIAVEKILNSPPISPPQSSPEEQVGFADTLPDSDGFLRRSLLGAQDENSEAYLLSLVTRLAEQYLKAEGIELGNGIRDPDAMRFGQVELPRFRANDGGYIRAEAEGTQMLVNFRSGPESFAIVSLRELMTGQVSSELLQDRVVLVGITADSVKDIVNSAAIAGAELNLVPGVVFQAHATSQILSGVLDGRPFLSVWPEWAEYGWILIWGLGGLGLGRLSRSPGNQLQLAFLTGSGLLCFAYVSLLIGVWIPLLPALAVFSLNSIVFYTFYVYDRGLRERIQARQILIERSYDDIHNGPLQHLAILRQKSHSQQLSAAQLTEELDRLNQEVRQVYTKLQEDSDLEVERISLDGNQTVKLDASLHELLYEVYCKTIVREFPGFANIRLKMPEFEPLAEQGLTRDQKRSLCRFLEESLCNVGKYAQGATRLEISCRQEGERNVIQVIDNGTGPLVPPKPTGGQGTRQAKGLAKRLGGEFKRIARSPRGVHCELNWPVRQSWRSQLSTQLRTFLQSTRLKSESSRDQPGKEVV